MNTADNIDTTMIMNQEEHKELSTKFSSKTWGLIEQLVSPQEKSVYNSILEATRLLTHGNSNSNTEIIDTFVLTDVLYKRIRNILVENQLVESIKEIFMPIQKQINLTDEEINYMFQKPKSSKKKKIGMTADEIKLNNTFDKLKIFIIELMTMFDNLNPDLDDISSKTIMGFNSKYIEIIGLTFIYMNNFYVRQHHKFSNDVHFQTVLSVIISTNRFIESCENFIGINPVLPETTLKISQIFIKDIQYSYQKLTEKYPFDGIKVCKYAPSLLISSPYDKYVKITAFKPREHQVRILNEVHNNYENGFFIIYNAMINSGKTTSIIGLANLAKHYNKKLLCVCNIDTVRIQMATLCYNNEIKFAIGSLRDDKTIKITHHWTTKDNNSTVIISSPEVAINILKNDTQDSYILFHDEPTAGSDTMTQTIYDNVNVLLNAPKWVIFSSATSPTLEEMTPLINVYKQKYGNIHIGSIYSSTISVSCHVRAFNGTLIVPFANCKTRDNILSVIQKIKEIPFIGRMLSPDLALCFYKIMDTQNIQNVPNIPELFRDVKNMKTDKIREVVINMLLLLSSEDDEIITNICTHPLFNNINDKFDIDNIENSKWECMTLITTNNPVSLVLGKYIEIEEETTKYFTNQQPKNETRQMFVFDKEEIKIVEAIKDNIITLYFYGTSYDILEIIQNKLSLRKSALVIIKSDEEFKMTYNIKSQDEYDILKRKIKQLYGNFIMKPVINFMYETTEISEDNITIKETIKKNVFKNGVFSSLLDKLRAEGIKNTSVIIDTYKKELQQWNIQKDKKEKELGDKCKNNTLTVYERALEERKIYETKPKHKFPKYFQLGTNEYNAKFAPLNEFDREYIDIDKLLEQNKDMNVPDDLLLLLLCGIGVYSPSNILINENYTNAVIELATQGKLAYVISDNSISYGTNYPFGKVVIMDDFVETHSVNTMFQLMGRAGRVGKLPKATAFVSQKTGDTLTDYVVNPSKYSIEANNINKIVLSYKIDTSIQDEIRRLEEELFDDEKSEEVIIDEKKNEEKDADEDVPEDWDM